MWPDVSCRIVPDCRGSVRFICRRLSFLKTSVIYLFSVSLMSCHGLERKPNVADVRMAFSY